MLLLNKRKRKLDLLGKQRRLKKKKRKEKLPSCLQLN